MLTKRSLMEEQEFDRLRSNEMNEMRMKFYQDEENILKIF